MSNISVWTNVGVAVQSALGTPITISAITKANPGVVTATSHGLSNGDVILLSVNGMAQLDGRVVRVANVTTNTFELEGVNTTDYDTFTSGNARKITFGTTLASATSVNVTGGDFDFIDTTTIHDTVRRQIPGLANAATFTFESIWDVSDQALLALASASEAKQQRAVRITFANGQKVFFNGYVGATLLPTGGAHEVVKTSVSITMFGRPTYYAS
jgi:hypothetical protein